MTAMISAPDSYGLDEMQTLAFRVDTPPPHEFESYWSEFREEILAQNAAFASTPNDSVNRVGLTSLRSVRIVGRLTLTTPHPNAIVLTSHGYQDVPDIFTDEEEPWSKSGLGTLRIRVRGFPPSVQDVPDLRGAWIMRNIESHDAWIARGAVADLIQSFRALRRHFGPDMPIMIHGESFGAGLSIIAASQLIHLGDAPSRMAIALPSFGAWEWRRSHYCSGAGAQVNMAIESMRAEDERVMRTLRLFDAVFHARHLTMPILVKTAVNDDVVPAPTQSAIFHAIPEGHKYRFITRYGHFDGGVAHARRQVLFDRFQVSFLDPANNPTELLHESADQLTLPPAPTQDGPKT